jgi:hypothetical protein
MKQASGFQAAPTQIFEKVINSILQETPPNTDTVLKDQVTQGWKQILQGKVTKDGQQWITTQLQIPKIKETQISNLVITSMKQWKKAWDCRNENTDHNVSTQLQQTSYTKKDLEYIYNN